MEATVALSTILPRSSESKPTNETLKKRLQRHGVVPTPKILHSLSKKEAQKTRRRHSKTLAPANPEPSSDDSLLETISAEYRALKEKLAPRGRPWERKRSVDLRKEGFGGGKLKGEYLEELRGVLEEREVMKWVVDDGDLEEIEEEGEGFGVRLKENISEDEKIRFLLKRLNTKNLSIEDWKFPRVMKQSGIIFTEMHLLKIVESLGALGNWKLALSVVEWVYSQQDYKDNKSRFVYTKLLSVLGRTRRPQEAYQIFSLMREDGKLYPDMAAYHAIAGVLGQAGHVNKLIGVIEFMRQKPSKKIKNMKRNDWDPTLEPDIIIYNSVLNACVPRRKWKGVTWVLQQMRLSGLRPSETTYGLAMEVMLKAGKYDMVHKYYETMRRGGLATKALTYKVLVITFWKEGKVDEALQVVRDMEQRGVVGTASVYYELARCLCNKGRWQESLNEVEKLKRLPHSKPLEVTFTGMILSALKGGYISDCISIFEYMKGHCTPNIGTINAMLQVYRLNDMFGKAKELFESVKDNFLGSTVHLDDGKTLEPDEYSYSCMLEASASAHQWEYFESLYREMIRCNFQLNHNKHAWLLAEASRAGKSHLLEHAFDAILEADSIPHTTFFTEVICESIFQQNFERVVSLVNNMAYASMQVSGNQWTDLFQRNSDRLDKNKMQNLLNFLDSSKNLVSEEPLPSFVRSLRLILDNPTKIQISLPDPIDDNIIDEVHICEDGDHSHTSASDLTLGSLTANVSNSSCKLPSSSEILDTWKERRIKDGMFSF